MDKLNPEIIDLIRKNQELINRNLKRWIRSANSNDVPELEEVIQYLKGVYASLGKCIDPYLFGIENTYNKWLENDWRDCTKQRSPIKNWKSKFRNQIQFIRPVYPDRQPNAARPQAKRQSPVRIGVDDHSSQREVEDASFIIVE